MAPTDGQAASPYDELQLQIGSHETLDGIARTKKKTTKTQNGERLAKGTASCDRAQGRIHWRETYRRSRNGRRSAYSGIVRYARGARITRRVRCRCLPYVAAPVNSCAMVCCGGPCMDTAESSIAAAVVRARSAKCQATFLSRGLQRPHRFSAASRLPLFEGDTRCDDL
ncbi:hypothetical protein MRX96_042931 [Rhipicephalus microplus]